MSVIVFGDFYFRGTPNLQSLSPPSSLFLIHPNQPPGLGSVDDKSKQKMKVVEFCEDAGVIMVCKLANVLRVAQVRNEIYKQQLPAKRTKA